MGLLSSSHLDFHSMYGTGRSLRSETRKLCLKCFSIYLYYRYNQLAVAGAIQVVFSLTICSGPDLVRDKASSVSRCLVHYCHPDKFDSGAHDPRKEAVVTERAERPFIKARDPPALAHRPHTTFEFPAPEHMHRC